MLATSATVVSLPPALDFGGECGCVVQEWEQRWTQQMRVNPLDYGCDLGNGKMSSGKSKQEKYVAQYWGQPWLVVCGLRINLAAEEHSLIVLVLNWLYGLNLHECIFSSLTQTLPQIFERGIFNTAKNIPPSPNYTPFPSQSLLPSVFSLNQYSPQQVINMFGKHTLEFNGIVLCESLARIP